MAIGDKLADQVGRDCPQGSELGTDSWRAQPAVVPKVAVKLRCASCGVAYAELQNGCLVVQSRHHGEIHVNVLPVSKLVKMC